MRTAASSPAPRTRTTNARWHIIASDGLLTDRLVAHEFFVVDEDENRASAAYSAAWGAHDVAVEQPGLAFDVTMLRRSSTTTHGCTACCLLSLVPDRLLWSSGYVASARVYLTATQV